MTTTPPATITHLLVPLDGSALAESALPATTRLARALPARVTLLHVMERDAPATVHGHDHLDDPGEAEAYLAGWIARLAAAGVRADGHVHPNPEGDVARSIAEHAAELGADLIVLCAHGEGGARGWWAGTMAQQTIRRAAPPVLMVRPAPGSAAAPEFAPRTVLVALDGTPQGEAALPAALELARALGAGLLLARVVPTASTLGGDRAATALFTPAATAAALDLDADDARAELAALAARLAPAGVPVRHEVLRGDAVRKLAEAAERAAPGLLAVATHAHTGLDALWAGSVGSRVVGKVTTPLLLVHR